jgi:hypothetical protein
MDRWRTMWLRRSPRPARPLRPGELPLPRRPAGPARPLTCKINGKTITRLVPDDQLDDYRQWLDNPRRLRARVAELEALTLAIADAGPRGKCRPAGPSGDTRQTTT